MGSSGTHYGSDTTMLAVLTIMMWIPFSYVLEILLVGLVRELRFTAAKLLGTSAIFVDTLAVTAVVVCSAAYWYPHHGVEATVVGIPAVAALVFLIRMKVCRLVGISQRRAEQRPDHRVAVGSGTTGA